MQHNTILDRIELSSSVYNKPHTSQNRHSHTFTMFAQITRIYRIVNIVRRHGMLGETSFNSNMNEANDFRGQPVTSGWQKWLKTSTIFHIILFSTIKRRHNEGEKINHIVRVVDWSAARKAHPVHYTKYERIERSFNVTTQQNALKSIDTSALAWCCTPSLKLISLYTWPPN